MTLRCSPLASRQTPHDVTAGPQATYARIVELSRAVLQGRGREPGAGGAGRGCSVPGQVDLSSGQSRCAQRVPGWNGVAVASERGARLGLPTLSRERCRLRRVLAERRFRAAADRRRPAVPRARHMASARVSSAAGGSTGDRAAAQARSDTSPWTGGAGGPQRRSRLAGGLRRRPRCCCRCGRRAPRRRRSGPAAQSASP